METQPTGCRTRSVLIPFRASLATLVLLIVVLLPAGLLAPAF